MEFSKVTQAFRHVPKASLPSNSRFKNWWAEWLYIYNIKCHDRQCQEKAIVSTMKFIILSAICFSMTLSVEFSVIHRTDSDFRVDPEDCSRFYIRRNGKEFQFKCPGDDVVNTFTRSCVPKGSSQDTCM